MEHQLGSSHSELLVGESEMLEREVEATATTDLVALSKLLHDDL